MDDQNAGQDPLVIPNLKSLRDTLEEGSDGQELLDVFKDPANKLADSLTSITDAWLTEAREEENAA